MDKTATHEEKLELYKNYYSKEFQEKLDKKTKLTNKLFFATLISLPITSIVLGIFNPWMFFTLIPAFAIPFAISAIEGRISDNLVKELNKKFTLNDVYDMIETGEWAKLGMELSAIEMKTKHYVENKSYIADAEKQQVVNTPRSLDCCIMEEEIQETTNNSKKLIKKSIERNKKRDVENIQKKYGKCIITGIEELKEIEISFSLLNVFCNKFNRSLIDYKESDDFETSNTYYLQMKDAQSNRYDFMFSHDFFVGVYEGEDINLTKEWHEYLFKKLDEIKNNSDL